MSFAITKARMWVGVLYPENMVEDWENKIGDVVQLPYAYALHTKDIDTKSEHRKDHIHLILVFPNTTTYNHALSVFSLLNAPGKKAVNTCEAVINIRHCYDYLIHDTENAKKQGKFVYEPEHRVTGNLFDIGSYEQLGAAEKREMLKELCDFIIEEKICNLADFYIGATAKFSAEHFDIISAHNAMLDRLCRGNYLRFSNTATRSNTPATPEKCPHCGSTDVKKNGKSAGGMQRFVCKECGGSYV